MNKYILDDHCFAATSACRCVSCHHNITYTWEELEAVIEALRADLLVSKETTSMYMRTKICAVDRRPSARALGYTGCMFLLIYVVCLLAMDAGNLLDMFRAIRQNLCPLG